MIDFNQVLSDNLISIVAAIVAVTGSWTVYRVKQNYTESELEKVRNDVKGQDEKFTILIDKSSAKNGEMLDRMARVETKLDIILDSIGLGLKSRN